MQLWTMPITGGHIRFVALVAPDPDRPGGRDGRMYRLEIAGDQIVWWTTGEAPSTASPSPAELRP
ncbi:hypothetical protein AB0C33_18790 [Nonomuraea sp. NPDC048881]|uniref:hypothetical protein n=1 Tax=Nonomuraea sp. NPDC048881 TaxID=3155030 RepID=UPI0033C0CC3A